MQHRHEIDGLRAVAIIPVLLFHAGIGAFSGGYVGVDVFFVISGYLITGIIHRGMQDGSYSILRFYDRRARRILPALLAVCAACLPFAWFWMLPDEFTGFSASLLSVLGFGSNYYFLSETGYFEVDGALKPLLHTWSLAVEEQFYIVLPLLMWALQRYAAKWTTAAIAVLSLASFGLALYWSVVMPEANFYVLLTRFWELGAGSLLALLPLQRLRSNGVANDLLSLAGLGMILFAVLRFDDSLHVPNAWSLLPVGGAALVILCADERTLAGRLLCWRPLVFVGLISYSLYLWHQPLFAFARLRVIDGLGIWENWGIILAAFILATLSWRFIEQPFRTRKQVLGVRPLSYFVPASLLLAGVGISGLAYEGFPHRVSARAAELKSISHDRNPMGDECNSGRYQLLDPAKACNYGTPAPHSVALLGDSHANMLAPHLAEELKSRETGMVQMTYAGCLPAPGFYRSDRVDACSDFNAAVQNHLRSEPEIQAVVLNARWNQKLMGYAYDVGEGVYLDKITSAVIPIGMPLDYVSAPERPAEIGALIRKSIGELLQSGKRVVLVYPEPEAAWDVPRYMAQREMFGLASTEPLSTGYKSYLQLNGFTIAELDRIPDSPGLLRIRPTDIFCNVDMPGRCSVERDGMPLYHDNNHFSHLGARLLAAHIAEKMEAKGWLPPR
jgi:peptidoglycan/LPS O-acetylase OafA/YrhL